MANELDEMTGPVNSAGRDINVIEKQLTPKIGIGSAIFELVISFIGFVPALIVTLNGSASDTAMIILWIAGALPAVIYWWLVIKARNYFQQLQQKIQAHASDIDNYLEQRVVILNNLAGLVSRAIDLDKDVMKNVAAFRGGAISDGTRSEIAARLDTTFHSLVPHVEAYPELRAHDAVANAIQQNSYLQKEITAARTLYNDKVQIWNTDIFAWPVKMIVAARAGYTTRIPFTASAEIKAQARGTFF